MNVFLSRMRWRKVGIKCGGVWKSEKLCFLKKLFVGTIVLIMHKMKRIECVPRFRIEQSSLK